MRREAAYSVFAPQSPLGSASPRPNSATTELEDQISALLRSEPAYSPSTCASSSSPLGTPMDLGVVVRCSADGGAASSAAASSSSPVVPHDEWRARIADWSYRVVDHFRYDREVVSVSMNYFDRFLLLTKTDGANSGGIVANAEKNEMSCDAPLSPTSSASAPNGGGGAVEGEQDEEIDSRTYQLAAMTSLYLAVKLHGEQPEETPPPESPSSSDAASASKPSSRCGGAGAGAGGATAPVSPARRPPPENRRKRRRRRRLRLLSFVELSRGQFNAEDITGMESRMLSTLRWRVNPPTPMVFVSYLLRLLPASPPAHSVIHRPREFGMTEAEYRDSIHEERQRHDLVLHILHELSRYLAELSVCLSDVSASHDPSTLAYAAVLVSAECLTSEALPPSLLDDFLGDVESLSPKLARDSPDVTYLVGRMKEAFLPELLLDGTSSACAAADGAASEGTGHPIAIAREAGLLDVDALYGRGGGPDGSEDVQTDAGYEYCESQYEENLKRQQRRNDSSCCVIEGALRNDQALRGSPKRPQGKAVSVEDEEQDSPVCVSRHAVVLKN